MKDSILYNAIYEKDDSCWIKVTIQKINEDGRCATSKTEPIGENDLYFFEGEIFPASVVPPPDGSLKMIVVHHWFHNISTKIGCKLLIECEPIENTQHYTMKYPLNIKLKGNQEKRKKD